MNYQRPKAPPPVAHAPYNFVPFSANILTVEKDALPHHDVIDPTLKSGQTRITMKAETPVFVSNGNGAFFRTPGGHCAIPGSTVRGMTRANMKILGFGIVRPGEDLDDRRFFCRNVGKQIPHYKEVLGIEGDRNSGQRLTKVNPGYLCNEDGKFYIYPTQDGKYYPVSRKDLKDWGFPAYRTDVTKVIGAAYDIRNGTVAAACPEKNATAGMTGGGCVIYPGSYVGNKPNKLCLFPRIQKNDPIALTSESVDTYMRDLEERKTNLKTGPSFKDKNGKTITIEHNVDFWALPDRGQCKPVFYCEYEGKIYFGMSRFLRIEHKHGTAQGVPATHKDAAGAIDLADAILGYTDRGQSSYRSRVSFGDLLLQKEMKELPPIEKLLAGPKASWCSGYLKGNGGYSHQSFELRGYKQYWLKPDEPSGVVKSKVTTTIRPLPKGSEFSGVIRYKNLTQEELGLLLWALELEEDCCQTVGMGKPYGFGRMKLTIEQVDTIHPQALYRDLWAQPQSQTPYKDHIRLYKSTLSKVQLDELEDFFYIKRQPPAGLKLTYMSPGDCVKATSMPQIREIRRKNPPAQKAPEHKTPPADTVPRQEQAKLHVGMITQGTVTGYFERNGNKTLAFMTLACGGRGAVHISQIRPYRVEDITKELPIGTTVKVKVTQLRDNGDAELSIKQVD